MSKHENKEMQDICFNCQQIMRSRLDHSLYAPNASEYCVQALGNELNDLKERLIQLEENNIYSSLAEDLCDRIHEAVKNIRLSGESLDECVERLIKEKAELEIALQKIANGRRKTKHWHKAPIGIDSEEWITARAAARFALKKQSQ
ncbi:hypothetical protein CMI47_13220 [Candidatus Pacearchaeota archaeon]|nr:hypothetical protein [Candidatus Pacearchaeota archaeon]|tara:strand:- start:425 stop:862 length:438 start_codon:yes stop_codon:yes gene_type:complete